MGGLTLLFPTDLTSFLDLIRQHGDAAYSFMFAYAASHSLLLALFAGYAAHSGALDLGTLIVVCWFGSFAGDVIRFWIGRRYGARLLARFPRFERPVQTVVRLTDRHYIWMIMFHRFPHGVRGLAGFVSLSCLFYSLSKLPLSIAMMIAWCSPIFVIAFFFLRGEGEGASPAGTEPPVAGATTTTTPPGTGSTTISR